jgi:hypothetical protein
MAYGYLMDFMFDVGIGVGEFLQDEEKAEFTPMTLAQIVKDYIDKRNFLCVVFLRRNIKRYIKHHMTADGLEYADPFDQELSFAEDYFEGDLHVFLTNVLSLLEAERKSRLRRYFLG